LADPEPYGTVLGSAGTIGALANFIRRRPSATRAASFPRATFSMRELSRASAALRKMNLARRQRAPGIEERRAEIIVAGSVILEEICAHLGARTVRVVRRGLRDGLMLEEIERLGLCQPLQPDASRQRMSWSDHSRQSRRRATLSITCTASRTASDDRLHMSIDQR
jgi:exopolyphosphatase/pppGpp-phosphohydrolase